MRAVSRAYSNPKIHGFEIHRTYEICNCQTEDPSLGRHKQSNLVSLCLCQLCDTSNIDDLPYTLWPDKKKTLCANLRWRKQVYTLCNTFPSIVPAVCLYNEYAQAQAFHNNFFPCLACFLANALIGVVQSPQRALLLKSALELYIEERRSKFCQWDM